jgi:hypothetical protein
MSIAHTPTFVRGGQALVRPFDHHPAQQIRVDLVAGLGLGRAWTPIERLDPHPPHQRFGMPSADLAPLGSQQTSQHPRAGERKLQMQPIKTPHDGEVGFRHSARQVINAATADGQSCRLLADRQVVCTVDHRLRSTARLW